MGKKRFIILSVIFLGILTVAGCKPKEKALRYTYKWGGLTYWDALYITETDYYDDRVEIMLLGKYAQDPFTFSSPDESGAVTDRQDNKLIIYSSNPTAITSLHISDSWLEMEVRYLNTERYSAIWHTWADDLGWTEYYGDIENYYTEEEKKQQREAEEKAEKLREAARKEDEELFAVFEGTWVSAEDDYFEIYDANPGHGVIYYQKDTQRKEEYEGFVFSVYDPDNNLYQMTYEQSGFGVRVTYDIEYEGGDSFRYLGKTFTKVDKEAWRQERNRTRAYFENLDKESSLDQIIADLGPCGYGGSGIIYHIWQLNDGTQARLIFDSNGKISMIYIVGDESSERIYKREYE